MGVKVPPMIWPTKIFSPFFHNDDYADYAQYAFYRLHYIPFPITNSGNSTSSLQSRMMLLALNCIINVCSRSHHHEFNRSSLTNS